MTLPLDQAIQHYEAAIAALAQAARPVPAVIVLEALNARDGVQAALADADHVSGAALQTISKLDQQLRNHASEIAPFIQAADWRASFSPKETAWWWWLEAPKPKQWSQFDWLWTALSVTFLTISLGLVGDISTRFLKGGPDTAGAIAVSTQSILTLLAAGGALTKAGQEASKQSLKKLNVSEQYWHELGTVGSGVLLLGLIGLRQSLPAISSWYTDRGREAYDQKAWGSAEAQYKRALELNADNTSAHFWLGRLYEDLQKPDEARTQYQYAIADDPNAVNNLARLSILKKDYPTAISLLQKPLSDEQTALEPATKFALMKNMGWVRLKQGNATDAETWLDDAIKLGQAEKLPEKTIAAAHCLQAQVIEAQGDPKKPLVAQKQALPEWKKCAGHGTATVPEEDEWMTTAQQRLPKLEEGQ
ncbi:tetratricopeptide repeat protein (plasmid) [Phormidium sp. CLA17]|uniref:tetratricopeptide repeat protein n=1 Tax=Leptolyngbya sp. Cla-17 TaxID=2803751 RepID=UPI001490C666|nr:tetratricopeptide repeat protein [Leptolyngbya sp. Cla-17]MBM0745674.1 tetratricopeptide repeat protein [Leptolyngbya sp. Cla-17]